VINYPLGVPAGLTFPCKVTAAPVQLITKLDTWAGASMTRTVGYTVLVRSFPISLIGTAKLQVSMTAIAAHKGSKHRSSLIQP
jgi:hypothetical protein